MTRRVLRPEYVTAAAVLVVLLVGAFVPSAGLAPTAADDAAVSAPAAVTASREPQHAPAYPLDRLSLSVDRALVPAGSATSARDLPADVGIEPTVVLDHWLTHHAPFTESGDGVAGQLLAVLQQN